MSILAYRRPAGRSPRRLLRPLSVLGVAALAASVLAACSSWSAGGSADTLVIVEWTNAAAVSYTQTDRHALREGASRGHVNLETAPTAGNGWPTLEDSVLASKDVDVLAEFPASADRLRALLHPASRRATRRRSSPRTSC